MNDNMEQKTETRKVEINYSKGKIYKLTTPHSDKIYIGSTTQTLIDRLYGHRGDYRKYLKDPSRHNSACELIKLGDVRIELLEEINCTSRYELLLAERRYIEQMRDICINICLPTRSKKEYKTDNKEKILEYDKLYREKNKERISEYRKSYYEKNKEKINARQNERIQCDICGIFTTKANISAHKKKQHIS